MAAAWMVGATCLARASAGRGATAVLAPVADAFLSECSPDHNTGGHTNVAAGTVSNGTRTRAEIVLLVAGIYLLCGLLFAIPFVLVGVGRIDPHAVHGSCGFRVLITPGTIFLWPMLARRWLRGEPEPPIERKAHRCAARQSPISHLQCERRRALRSFCCTSSCASGRSAG